MHSIGHPVLNETGNVVEFVGAVLDSTEQTGARIALENALTEVKLLRDQLYKENLALRDEVDRVSMFEEILGTSQALQAVVSRVIKVASTDSSVLITGETGTGKELIARAIDKRSMRSQRAELRSSGAFADLLRAVRSRKGSVHRRNPAPAGPF
jgi:transcriptional regulator with GAF, ATPase, and Fis domain